MYNIFNISPRPLWQHMHTWGRFVLQRLMMSNKEFKTIEEQIEILSSRGLSIPDKELAREFLTRNNYYRVSGYSLTLRNHDVFFQNVTFQNIVDIYSFDHELRHILLTFLETIEVTIKSIYSHEFTKIYGPTGYLSEKNYMNEEKHSEIMSKANAQKEARLPHEAYLKHFVRDLKQDIPLWAFVDLLTISDISFLYAISKPELKKIIADQFGFTFHNGTATLGNMLHKITIIRNLCAHGSRLYNRLFEQKPPLNKKELKLLRMNKNGQVDNAHLYGYILIMRRLLPSEDFQELKNSILRLTEKYPFVRMDYYGFRDDWKEVL